MNGPGHRILGASCALQFDILTNQPVSIVIVTTLIASMTAHGRLSPDIDLYPIWRRRLSRLAPRGSRGHRYFTHLWWWPAILGSLTVLFWYSGAHGRFAASDGWNLAFALPGAVAIGWLSHLLGDFLFGKRRYQRVKGRLVVTQGAGIPMSLRGDHKGLGWFKVGNATERVTTFVTLPVICVLQAYLLMGGSVYTLTQAGQEIVAAWHEHSRT